MRAYSEASANKRADNLTVVLLIVSPNSLRDALRLITSSIERKGIAHEKDTASKLLAYRVSPAGFSPLGYKRRQRSTPGCSRDAGHNLGRRAFTGRDGRPV